MGRKAYVVMSEITPTVAVAVADDKGDDVSQTFERKEYDVTGYCVPCCCIPPGICVPIRILTLEPEEAHLKQTNICSTTTKVLPYGELGSVELATACGCCISLQSELTAGGAEGNMGLTKGFGCDNEYMKPIYEELKARQRGRGDQAQIKRAEQTADMIKDLDRKIDLIMKHLDIKGAPSSEDMVR